MGILGHLVSACNDGVPRQRGMLCVKADAERVSIRCDRTYLVDFDFFAGYATASRRSSTDYLYLSTKYSTLVRHPLSIGTHLTSVAYSCGLRAKSLLKTKYCYRSRCSTTPDFQQRGCCSTSTIRHRSNVQYASRTPKHMSTQTERCVRPSEGIYFFFGRFQCLSVLPLFVLHLHKLARTRPRRHPIITGTLEIAPPRVSSTSCDPEGQNFLISWPSPQEFVSPAESLPGTRYVPHRFPKRDTIPHVPF